MFKKLLPDEIEQILGKLTFREINAIACTSINAFGFFAKTEIQRIRKQKALEALPIDQKVACGVKNETYALYLLKYHSDVLGKYNKENLDITNEKIERSPFGNISPFLNEMNSYNGAYLMQLAEAHVSAKEYILKHLPDRLSNNQKESLQRQSYLQYKL